MSIIRPFRAFRPAKGYEDKIPSFPYDVVNSREAKEIAKDNPFSFLHVVKPEIDLPEGTDLYSEEVYKKALENFKKLIDAKNLIEEDKPCLYIYSQKMGDHFQSGIVGLASAKEYDEGKIKKHEHTLTKKVVDRTKHVKTTGANAGPVFLTYKKSNAVSSMVKKVQKGEPLYDVTFTDKITHKVWKIEDETLIEKIVAEFGKLDALYIADGHHRSEAAAQTYRDMKTPETEHFLAVFFPDKELNILDYNRLVKDLNGLTKDQFIEKLGERFTIGEMKQAWKGRPRKRHQFGMFLDGKWHLLIAKKAFIEEKDPVKKLDSYIVQNSILDPVLGIKDPKTDKRIDFVGGIRGTGELEKRVASGEFAVAFSMFPTSIGELIGIADAGQVMPPKSTWFEPKLRSGFLINVFRKP